MKISSYKVDKDMITINTDSVVMPVCVYPLDKFSTKSELLAEISAKVSEVDKKAKNKEKKQKKLIDELEAEFSHG